MENRGILYVFPVFHSAWLAKKISFPAADDLFRDSLASIKINGKEDPKFIRDYSSPKRAISAIQSTVRRAGYEW